jgi:putative ABC transport system substrate-binding protein
MLDMRRREFITLVGGAAVWPLTAGAQQGERMRRIGVLITFAESDPDSQSLVRALVQRLQELGWSDGRNIRIDYRWAAAERGRAQALAEELVEMHPDLIVACAGPAAVALWRATRSIPIVFVQVIDPVALGIVKTMAHPGGNITGFTHFEATIGGKWLELLKEIVPGVDLVTVLFDPDNPTSPIYVRAIELAAPSFGVKVESVGARNNVELERAFNTFTGGPNHALIVLPNPVAILHRDLTLALAARHRLPTIYPHGFFVESGGLLSYGVNLADMYRRSATYVDRMLRGAKPADLPVQAPTKLELIINLKTATALGLEIPATLLARADEVIE